MLNALRFVKTPALLRAVYGKCIWKINTREKIIYLTFDDGPVPEATSFVLDELNKWSAKATFFCIGKNVAAHPELFERIKLENHTIGNHTYDHLNGWNCPDTTYYENVQQCSDLFVSDLFRPPYGKLKPSQYRHLKQQYSIVMWDVLSYDFDTNVSAEKVWWNVMKHTGGGSIVVFHDSLKALPHLRFVLPRTLEHFTKTGYKFKPL